MRTESGYYPPGAEFDPRAPWNQPEPEEINVDVTVSTTLHKNSTVTTYDAITIEEIDYDQDDDGRAYKYISKSIDYSECNLVQDYSEQYKSIPQLLNILVEYLEKEKNEVPEKSARYYELLELINNASNWIEDEVEVIKD